MTPLYRRLLGEGYLLLPPAIQQLHDCTDELSYRGECRVRRGDSRIANLLANFLSLPRADNHTQVSVHFSAKGPREIWLRRFNGCPFRSVQWQVGDLLYERLNLTTLVFGIAADKNGLALELKQVKVLGIPLMQLLNPHVIARETETEGRFHFFIRTTLPLLGLLVEYEGYLEKAD